MSENEPALPADAVIRSSRDVQLVPEHTGDEVRMESPDLGLSERAIAQPPRWPHPNFFWSLLWCVLFVILTQLPGAFVAVAILAGLAVLNPRMVPEGSWQNPVALMKLEAMNVALGAAFFVTEVIVIGFSWLVIRLVVGRDWTRQLALRRPALVHTLLVLAGFPAMWLLSGIAYEVLHDTFHVPSIGDYGGTGMKEMEAVFSHWQWAFAVMVIGLGPGIGEELWCRGFLGRGLIGNYGFVVGIIASSFFFGLIHIDPCQGAMAMVMGLWLHFVYVTTRSLLLPMLLHFLNNSCSVLFMRLPPLQLLDSKPQEIPWTVYLSGLLLMVGVAYALYQSRARLQPKSPEPILLWRPAFAGVEYPPAESGMYVAHPLPSLTAASLAGGAFALFLLACANWIRGG